MADGVELDAPSDGVPSAARSAARLQQVQASIAGRLTDADVAHWWHERVRAAPDRTAVRADDTTLSYRELDHLVALAVRWGRACGLRDGDTVALQLPTGPAFLVVVLAMAEIGASMSLLGTGLRGRSLRHALAEVPPALVVSTSDRRDEILATGIVTADRLHELTLTGSSGEDDLAALRNLLAPLATGAPAPELAIDRARPPARPDETLFSIFTSGTTGLPKATRCSHRRYLVSATSEAVLLGMDADACMYVVLPMFHIAALSAIGAALGVNASVAIRPRFSARSFWDDVHRFSVTHFQYLGEILRYLLARPAGPHDRPNTMQAMIGAGADERTWRAFVERFGAIGIIESYGSSEGVIGVYNLDGVIGSVGRPAPDLAPRLAIVRTAPTDEGLARDEHGRLARCAAGEPGELIARLDDRSQFEGYSSEAATNARLLTDAFAPGDLWYRSGDLFREHDGYLYFVARLGDTFRWKGENVSSQQVADAICDLSEVAHAVVYGVEVPGQDGRAGMALVTITAGASLDGARLHDHLAAQLPAPAIPLFVRLGDGAASLTDTYKIGIARLVREGYATDLTTDPILVLDPTERRYVPLTGDALRRAGIAPAAPTDHPGAEP
jgi:fatty-acyl-CoA synthase